MSISPTFSYCSQDSRLLALPLEIRQRIYRNLLLNSKPLGYIPKSLRSGDDPDVTCPRAYSNDDSVVSELEFDILRFCRSTYDDGSAILYGENVFAFWVRSNHNWGPFFEFPMNFVFHEDKGDFPSKKTKRRSININMDYPSEYHALYMSTLRVCEVLADLPNLHSVHVKLDLRHEALRGLHHIVLEPFSLLRNVRNVSVKGYYLEWIRDNDLADKLCSQGASSDQCLRQLKKILGPDRVFEDRWVKQPALPSEYVEKLTGDIKGNSPVNHLPRMCRALVGYTDMFKHCEMTYADKLEDAFEAVQDRDIDAFVFFRGEVIAAINARIAQKEALVFAYDANQQENNQQVRPQDHRKDKLRV